MSERMEAKSWQDVESIMRYKNNTERHWVHEGRIKK